jgi:GTA TIM-barrel-like domain
MAKPGSLPYTNSNPRLTNLVDPKTGKINNAYVGFFSKLLARCGPGINPVADTMTLEQIGASVNALLAEARAQGWISSDAGAGGAGAFADAIQGVTMIPASGDFVYNTTDIQYLLNALGDDGVHISLNSHSEDGYTGTDFSRSLDDLQAQAVKCRNVNLFCGWFGDDLRASHCNIQPRVDDPAKITGTTPPPADINAIPWPPMNSFPWQAAGLLRNQAPQMTQIGGNAAYGSTPSDSSIVEGIQELTRRGFAVTFTPFLMMDIPSGSTLPSPYGGTQPAYPWRGRITLDDGLGGMADKTAAAATQIDAFVNGTWGYRRFILTNARLCASAGGVDTFVIGSEMRGLTWARSGRETFPFIDALVSLAAEVKAILPDANIIYTADWSENLNYAPADGSGDLLFHLDKLFMSPDITAVAFDNYWPLTDWRDVPMNGPNNIDELTYSNIYDFDYLMSNVQGGEGYDWYYASAADRTSQVRTPITDGDYGKPWVWRYKDITNWWLNRHYNRLGGVEQAQPTAWMPESKPIWMMETGCPAVDKGSNQPNVFVDPKSSESFYPYFSNTLRDDFIQQRYCHTMLRYFSDIDTDFVESKNPKSSVYDGRMVDASRIYLYTWDARPFEVFPARSDVWSDAANYPIGDWLTGRIPASANASLVIGGDMAQLRTILAPRDPRIVNPQSGELTKQWLIFFQTLGFTQGAAIPDLSANPSAGEIAAALNALLAALRDQKRIASG